ncbi:hypothetical protein [Streptomyces vilmorinianum]|uniref:hypothetical protein n=1 Tax=Streptomyces vilmorinianum TaxID=3051092 RepID=UPI0010FB1DD4|nr:hypothetical protein [Streptomyces vilmorinianum]
MGIAIFDAMGLAKKNGRRHKKLVQRQECLTERLVAETEAQERTRRRAYDKALVPFVDVFSRLKNVDLAELVAIAEPAETELTDVEVRRIQLDAVNAVATLAGGVAVGAGAGAVTFAAVGAFAAASTGTAISALSGAAATSATLAWLGGGSLTAGGGGVAAGTAVLTGIVALPVLLALGGFFEWKGRNDLREQRGVAAELNKLAAELRAREARVEASGKRSRQVRQLLDRLRKEIRRRLPALRTLVDGQDDYAVYTPTQRAEVAVLVGLAGAMVAVMGTPITDDDGHVTDLSKRVVKDTRIRLEALVTAQ